MCVLTVFSLGLEEWACTETRLSWAKGPFPTLRLPKKMSHTGLCFPLGPRDRGVVSGSGIVSYRVILNFFYIIPHTIFSSVGGTNSHSWVNWCPMLLRTWPDGVPGGTAVCSPACLVSSQQWTRVSNTLSPVTLCAASQGLYHHPHLVDVDNEARIDLLSASFTFWS